MTNIVGARNTGNILQNRIVVDMRNTIAQLQPDDAPFITFLRAAKGRTRVTHSPKFEWLEDDLVGNSTTTTSSTAASATSVAVADGSIFSVGDIIKLGTEQALVTAISTNTLTITPNYGTTARSEALASNSVVYIIGNAYMENARSGEPISTQEVNKYNYTQIFRTPIALSGTEDHTKLYGGKDRAYQRSKALLTHKRAIATAFYHGVAKEDLTGTAPRRTTGGLLSFMTNTCAFDSVSRPLTFTNFDTYVAQPAFRYGSKNKLLIAGPKLASQINAWANAKAVMTDMNKDDTFGITIKKLQTSYGDIKVMYDPLLADTGRADYGLLLDMDNINYAHLEGRDTQLRTNIQEDDRDGIKDEYLTECGLEVRLPKTHMLITGAYVG